MAVTDTPHGVHRIHDSDHHAESHPRLRQTWLLHKREIVTLFVYFGAIFGTWTLMGWALTRPLKDSSLVDADERISKWFVSRRTPTWNSLTYIGSMMSDTLVKIIITAVVSGLMLIVWKRWLEPLMVVVPLAFEALTFITTTWIVGRPRPDVPRLESSPVGSSFPSGHVAAAVVYSAMVIVLFWHTRRTWLRAIGVALAIIVPCCVGYSRVYRGMHHLTDVIAGALLGAVWVIVSYFVLRSAQRRYMHRDVSSVGEERLDAHAWPAPDPAGWRPYPERDTESVRTESLLP